MIQRADQFDKILRDFGIVAPPGKVGAIHGRVHLEALRRVVLKTPVDQGTYTKDGKRIRNAEGAGQTRGSWQSTRSTFAASDNNRQDPNGTAVIAEGQSLVATIKGPDNTWITSNKPWIEVLENGGYPDPPKNPGYGRTGQTKTAGGYSRQAPQGMMKRTVEELSVAFK